MPRMKTVMTVSPDRLVHLSQRLFETSSSGTFRPDSVVGIATGGVHVVEAMGLPEAFPVFTCRLSRPATQTKENASADRVLRRLPTPLANGLRILEDLWLARKPPRPSDPSPTLLAQIDHIAGQLNARDLSRVLVVDDAVDSGSTLLCVLDALRRSLGSDTEVRSAVLTVTRAPAQRCITPDFSLFERVLLRFPWSNDYKPSTAA